MKPSTVLRLASACKLFTIVSVLQGIERGLLRLDEDVSARLPELARQDILTGFTWYGRPLTTPRTQPIKLRELLTQTAGTGYDFLAGLQPLWRWRWWHGQPIAQGSTLEQRLAYPLLHEPGRGWTYGSGTSWAGRMLELASGVSLEEWIQEHICKPLGLTSVTFFPSKHGDVAERMAGVTTRNRWTGRVVPVPNIAWTETEGLCMGGEGIVSSMEDIMAVMYSLLADDEKLLKKETAAMMFTPQLTDAERPALRQCLDKPFWMCNSIIVKDEYDWGFGGVLVDGDSHEYLKRGTILWSGLYHVLWVSIHLYLASMVEQYAALIL